MKGELIVMYADTKVTAATIYRSGCVVTRKGTVHLPEGRHDLIIRGLSSGAEDMTARLALPESLEGSNVQVRNLTKEEKEEITKETERKIEELDTRIELLTGLAEIWKNNADFTGKESVNLSEMTDYLEKLPERIEKLGLEVRELQLKRADLQKELKEKEQESSRKVMTAQVNVPQEGTYPLEVRYHDAGAYWYPVYEIHTDGETSGLNLRLRAKLREMTGEDWNDVKVSLFTGNPSVSGTIPELNPVHVRFYQPMPRRQNALMGMMAMSMAKTAAVAEEEICDEDAVDYSEEQVEEIEAPTAEVKQGETMTEYELPGLWNLEKGRDVMADLSRETIEAEFHNVIVPKLDAEVFLAAEIKTSSVEHLMNTDADVYLKGTYAGQVHIHPDLTEKTYDISLGRDETVKVKRRQTKNHTSNVLLKGQKKTEYEFETVITSRKDKPCKITVWDQIPVSDDKSIVVESVELSKGVLEEKTGKIRYDFELNPKESKTLVLNYTVAWPKDKQIQEF